MQLVKGQELLPQGDDGQVGENPRLWERIWRGHPFLCSSLTPPLLKEDHTESHSGQEIFTILKAWRWGDSSACPGNPFHCLTALTISQPFSHIKDLSNFCYGVDPFFLACFWMAVILPILLHFIIDLVKHYSSPNKIAKSLKILFSTSILDLNIFK